MRALILLLAATVMSVTAPAAAQHQGHQMPQPAKPKPKPAAKKPATKKPAAKKPATKKKPAAEKPAEDPHAGHDMPEQPADPHAGHAMPEQPADPHAGHGMPEQQADPHAGHDVTAIQAKPPVAPPPPEALQGPEHAADQIYGAPAMVGAREELRDEHGDIVAYRVFVERAETSFRRGPDSYLLDAQGWYGGDIDKFWVKGEVEGNWRERPEHAEVQALWSHAIDPWFDLQAGLRYDPQPGPDRAHLVLGVQGLAPYWWEVDTAVFLSNKGEVTARAEAEYDLRITQKLILQPRGELNFALQNVRELGFGSGLSNAAVGLRLRYQVSQLFAPYLGVEYERAFGRTARYRRDEGERAGALNLLAGLRFWF